MFGARLKSRRKDWGKSNEGVVKGVLLRRGTIGGEEGVRGG